MEYIPHHAEHIPHDPEHILHDADLRILGNSILDFLFQRRFLPYMGVATTLVM